MSTVYLCAPTQPPPLLSPLSLYLPPISLLCALSSAAICRVFATYVESPLTHPSLLPPLRCQLIKIDAKYAKSRENPRGKFSKFSQLISQVTHAQQITRGVAGGSATGCSFLHMPYLSLSLVLTMCMVLLPRPPHGRPEAACVPSTNSVCLHLRIIDACREASLTASQSQLLSSLLLLPLLVYLLPLVPVLAGWRQQ